MTDKRLYRPSTGTALRSIAWATFQIGLRGRLLSVLGVVFFILGSTALVSYEMSIPIRSRILSDMGLSIGSLVGSVLSASLMIATFAQELSGRQAEPLLVRPIGRGVVLIGKWLGVVLLGQAFSIGCAVITCSTLMLSGAPLTFLLGHAFGMVSLELLVVSALTLFATTLGSQAFAASMVAACCLAGNLADDILALTRRQGSEAMKTLATTIFYLLPDLGRLSLRSAIANGIDAPRPLLAWAWLYGLGYAGACVTLAVAAYQRRDKLRSL